MRLILSVWDNLKFFGVYMRRDSREAVFTLLYRDLFNDEKDDGFIKKTFVDFNLSESDEKFALALYSAINDNAAEITEIISSLSCGFDFSRLFLADKCALKIGVAELKYFTDVPDIVAIDEAVSLTRKYSSEKSPSFVNGILAALKKKLDEEGGEIS